MNETLGGLAPAGKRDGRAALARPRRPAPAAACWSATALQPEAIVRLGRWLQVQRYGFTTVTPATHRRVLSHLRTSAACGLRDIFGWSRSFRACDLPREALELLDAGGALQHLDDGRLRSRIRFSTLEGRLFVHSAFPTDEADAVFFGPDTLRFAALVRRAQRQHTADAFRSVVEIGCGSGAVGLLAAMRLQQSPAPRLVLADLSAAALRCAEINVAMSGVAQAECTASDVLAQVDGRFDLILCNPPYLSDPAARLYRNGGSLHGAELSLRVVREALQRLSPRGRLVLYTGSTIVDGVDTFRSAVEPLLQAAGARYEYAEIDPDVFGEELDEPAYQDAERIAAVGLIATGPRP